MDACLHRVFYVCCLPVETFPATRGGGGAVRARGAYTRGVLFFPREMVLHVSLPLSFGRLVGLLQQEL